MSSIMFPDQQTSTSPADDAVENQEVDMSAEVEVENPEADASVKLPPPAGNKVYPIKYSLDDTREGGAVNPSMAKNGKPFLNIFIKGNLVAEGVDDGYQINRYMNTLSNRTGNSEAHYFLYCAGEPVPQKISLQDLKDKFEEVLASNPTILGLCDWEAQYATGLKNKKGKDEYRTIAEGMRNFPKVKNEEGKLVHNHIVQSPRDGSPIQARLKVIKDLTAAEAAKLKT